jgi:exosortase E/protease (VPEID-CTERM system)
MAAFSGIYVWAFRHRLRFPQAWLLVPLAVCASVVGNVLRIAALLEIGARISPAIALGGFHSQAGWVFLISVAVLVVGIAQRLPWFSRDLPGSLNLRESAAAACLAPFLVWNILGIVSQLTASDPGINPWQPLRWLALAIPLYYWRGIYRRMLRVDAAASAGLLTGAAAFSLWMLLESFFAPSQASSPAAGGALWMISRSISHVFAAPLIEELAFRGYLMRRLQAFRFSDVPFENTAWSGILISSVAFGLLHGERWLAGTLAGLIYALTVKFTGRLSAGVLAHITTNALLTLYVLLSGDLERWH